MHPPAGVGVDAQKMEQGADIGTSMQKTNTLLLVIIAGLLATLLLKPAARCYEVFQQNYLLDTASGRVLMIHVSDEVKADLRAKEAAKQAEKKAEEARDAAYKEERLSKSCPEVLAEPALKMATRKKGSLRDAMDEALLDEQKKECREWLRSKQAHLP
jgi:hypothetical protein